MPDGHMLEGVSEASEEAWGLFKVKGLTAAHTSSSVFSGLQLPAIFKWISIMYYLSFKIKQPSQNE